MSLHDQLRGKIGEIFEVTDSDFWKAERQYIDYGLEKRFGNALQDADVRARRLRKIIDRNRKLANPVIFLMSNEEQFKLKTPEEISKLSKHERLCYYAMKGHMKAKYGGYRCMATNAHAVIAICDRILECCKLKNIIMFWIPTVLVFSYLSDCIQGTFIFTAIQWIAGSFFGLIFAVCLVAFVVWFAKAVNKWINHPEQLSVAERAVLSIFAAVLIYVGVKNLIKSLASDKNHK